MRFRGNVKQGRVSARRRAVRAESLALKLLVVASASKRSSGARARSESRTESGLAAERLEVFRNETQADTAHLGEETTLPRGLR